MDRFHCVNIETNIQNVSLLIVTAASQHWSAVALGGEGPVAVVGDGVEVEAAPALLGVRVTLPMAPLVYRHVCKRSFKMFVLPIMAIIATGISAFIFYDN